MKTQARERALEDAADWLLQQAGRDPEYPAYSEQTLFQKERRARICDLQRAAREGLDSGLVMDDVLARLRRSEYEHMFQSSNLTVRERQVCRKVAQGQSFAEIAAALRVSPQAVHRTMTRARAKIAARWRVMPYRGLWKLYAEDVQRAIYLRR